MRKSIASALGVVLSAAVVSADVTVTQSMTMEGQMAAMAAGKLPQMVTRIKGLKARADIEMQGQTISSITDLISKQVTILQSATKTAMVMAAGLPPVPPGTPLALPKIDFDIKPTGQTKSIDGLSCSEHSLAMTLDMTAMGGGAQLPPEAAAAMKDVRLVANGAIWVTTSAPGVDEYITFQKAAVDGNLLAGLSGMLPQGGMDKLMAAVASAPGIPCLTEFTMSFEGTGPMVDAMKQMGPMKMVQKTTAISTDPVPEGIFVVPADYKIEKK